MVDSSESRGEGDHALTLIDMLAVYAVAHPKTVVKREEWATVVELNGSYSRGQLIVDRRIGPRIPLDATKVNFITQFDLLALQDIAIRMLKD